MNRRDFLHLIGASSVGSALGSNTPAPNHSKLVYPGKSDRLIYVPDSNGNTIPDFSNCGYMGGGVRLPDVPVRLEIAPQADDARTRIQDAIDRVSRLPVNKDGFRGAVLLKKGVHTINGPLRITASGVVLRGEGMYEGGTTLIATRRSRHSLIEIRGVSYGRFSGSPRRILDAHVPVGSRSFRIASSAGLRVGDRVMIRRIGNIAWIREIAMDRIVPRADGTTQQWKPFDLDFDRVITKISGERVTVDAPIVCAIEERWGGGELIPFDPSSRVCQVGVENFRGISEFDRTVTAELSSRKLRYFSDEAHAWDLINIDLAENVWVRKVSALHFGFSAVNVNSAKWVTVEDCKSGEMVSQITGSRRYTYNLNSGQLCLIQRCEAESGRHDFVVGARVAGPNAFVHCTATNTFSSSEPHHRWSTGGLFDNVKAPLAIQDRANYGTGHGWSGANYVAWNCEGSLICQKPPTAQNWAIGHVGEKLRGAFEPREDGYWESLGRRVEPASLYIQQLRDRLGSKAVKNISS